MSKIERQMMEESKDSMSTVQHGSIERGADYVGPSDRVGIHFDVDANTAELRVILDGCQYVAPLGGTLALTWLQVDGETTEFVAPSRSLELTACVAGWHGSIGMEDKP